MKKGDGNYITYNSCAGADKNEKEEEKVVKKLAGKTIFFKLTMTPGAIANFSYSQDGKSYEKIDGVFTARPGKWVGAKLGLFANSTVKTNDAGFIDVDWFRIREVNPIFSNYTILMERSTFIKYTAAAGAALMLNPFELLANKNGTKIRLAQVGTGHRGTGFWGKNLLTNFKDVVEFVGVYDVNPGRAAFAKELYGENVNVYSSFEEMLQQSKA